MRVHPGLTRRIELLGHRTAIAPAATQPVTQGGLRDGVGLGLSHLVQLRAERRLTCETRALQELVHSGAQQLACLEPLHRLLAHQRRHRSSHFRRPSCALPLRRPREAERCLLGGGKAAQEGRYATTGRAVV